jgi:serine/threonine protein kinase
MDNNHPIVNLDLSLFPPLPLVENYEADHLDNKFSITNHRIGKGHFAKVYQVCKVDNSKEEIQTVGVQDELKQIYNRLKELSIQVDNEKTSEVASSSSLNCNYAAKLLKRYQDDVLPHYQGETPACFTASEYNAREAAIIKRLSDLGIGAKVHAAYTIEYMDVSVSETYSKFEHNAYLRKRIMDVIIMEKYEGSLNKYFRLLHENKDPQYDEKVKEVEDECQRLIKIMHENGIVHADLNKSNFLYRINKEGLVEIVISDTGLAFLSDNQKIQRQDNMHSYPGFQFYKDGKPCSYIQKT